ncbi:phosphoethanolamine--lipid A transferase EptA [Luteimonas saliphila]|uniref:phosphoethanolamine--lipid A transferase EptA n=1 Tax=Luteimonas saliphila TaxID=2804919 RepID=UPI0023569755|nr:phosphoethanolamine--lipid A transferase EptA [Luteimonas saliphila]
MHALALRLLSGAFIPRVRWRLRTPMFVLAWALFNAVAYHVPLYLFGIDHLDVASLGAGVTLLTLFILVVALTALFTGVIASIVPRLVKPLCMAMAVANAIALYFVVTYGVVLDETMMGNTFNTDPAEVAGLFHPWMLVYVFCLGIVPCWVLLQIKVTHTPFLKRLAMPIAVSVFTLCWAYGASQSWLWIDKHAKHLGGMVLPWSYVVNGGRYLAGNAAPYERRLLPAAHFVSNEKKVVFLVIGESARARNFSLYGYGRQTNPALSKAGATVFKKARSCATYTTASLECILAHQEPGARAMWEPLTSYLQRHGVEVTWRTNNAGEPAMDVRHFERLGDVKADCTEEACDHDEGLLRGIEARIAASNQQRILVVFHLEGSHGPAYNVRYPSRFNVFTPVCASVQLHQCSIDELINAYDNTIVYTDFVVGQAIDMLKRLQGYSTSLIYVSDHGESLGEFNLYLHGTPLSIAPDVQKDIPLILWDSSAAHSNANATSIVEGEFSHANVFHSVMGAFGMRSDIFEPELNLFSPENHQ